jgi:N-acetylneuraminic acid mutarotase
MTKILAILLLQTGEWLLAPALPVPRQEVGVAAVEGRIFVIGGIAENRAGSSVVEIFDTRSNEWRAGPPLPIPLHHPNVAAVGSKVYVAGGYTEPGFAVADTYELDTDNLVWTRKANMPTGRGAGAAVGYNGRLYVFGGERGTTVAEAAVFDPAADRWTELAPMPTARNHMAAAALRGRIHVVGGRPGNLAVHEAYDPATNSWTAKSPMPTARSGIAVAAIGEFMHAFGGEGNRASPLGIFSNHEAYNVDLDEWTLLAPMPVPRHGIGAAVVGNRIYLPGGSPVEGFGTTAQSDFFNVNENLLVPQLAVGEGYVTELAITNPSASRTAEVSIAVSDVSGEALDINLDSSIRSSMTLTIPPLASKNIDARQAGNVSGLQVGTVNIFSNARLAAYAVIRHSVLPSVNVYPAAPARHVVFNVKRVQSTGANTGVAILNPSSQTVALSMSLIDSAGREIVLTTGQLRPGEKLSRFVHEIFPELQSADLAGTMTVRSGGQLAVGALAFDRSGAVTLPVTPID